VVKTMVSPGGHRLFNVASVLDYFSSQSYKSNVRQLIVFVRLDLGGGDQSQDKLDAAVSEYQSQVLARMKEPCTEEEKESCNLLLESLSSDDYDPGHPFPALFNTEATRKLLKCICSRKHTRSHLILRTWDDISSEQSTCALFKLLCRKMSVSIELLPQLPSQL
jgi:hypothetical protein